MNRSPLRRLLSAATLALVLPAIAAAQGFGGFSAPVFIALPSPQSVDRIAIADVDLDGYNDLLVTISNPNSLGFFRNNGDGTFLPPMLFNADAFLPPIGGLAVGDWNGDGFLDAATANVEQVAQLNNTISVFLNDGTGVYTALPLINIVGVPLDLAEGDFDGDGIRDLAVRVLLFGNPGNPLIVLRGLGDGTFASFSTQPVAGNPYSLAIADFDASGRDDLVAGATSQVSVHLATTKASHFGAEILFPVTSLGNELTYSVIAHDVDNNGSQDIVAGTKELVNGAPQEGVSILMNNGAASFASPQFFPTLSPGDMFGIEAVDLDGDGNSDLLTRQITGTLTNITVMVNDGVGSFASSATVQLPALTRDFATRDLNGDGSPDVAVAQPDSLTQGGAGSGVWVLFNQTTFPLFADLNGDGVVDGADLAILLVNWSGEDPCQVDPCPADLNGDGKVNGVDLAILLVNWTTPPAAMAQGGGMGDMTGSGAVGNDASAPTQQAQSNIPWILAHYGFDSVSSYMFWLDTLTADELADHIVEVLELIQNN